MVSQYLWIGIIAGVFVAGIGIGYVAFQQSEETNYLKMNQQQMQQIMNDPQQMAKWQQTMMGNPEVMNQWMQNPQHTRQMADLMKTNHEFRKQMMTEIINDPNTRLEMLGQMSENQEAMQQMHQMTQSQIIGNMTMIKKDTFMEEQVKKIVSDSIALYDLKGVEAFEIITSESKNLQPGELYPFVLDPNNITVVAHGFNPASVGTKSVSLTESDRPYEQILEDLKNNKGTWTEYQYENPDTQKKEIKRTWLYLHDDYIFACGYYLPN